MFSLTKKDWLRGLVVAVYAPLIVAVTAALGAVIFAPNFDYSLVDWSALLHNLINISIIVSYGAFMAYMSKNFTTNNEGTTLGIKGK